VKERQNGHLRHAFEEPRIMAANLPAMLRSMLKARQTASLIELRFLKEAARTLPAEAANTRKASRGRTLKCPRCDRRFARPVHLGRHLSATHGRNKKSA
jgi:uncharacterized C2H2 Zn-finger protein